MKDLQRGRESSAATDGKAGGREESAAIEHGGGSNQNRNEQSARHPQRHREQQISDSNTSETTQEALPSSSGTKAKTTGRTATPTATRGWNLSGMAPTDWVKARRLSWGKKGKQPGKWRGGLCGAEGSTAQRRGSGLATPSPASAGANTKQRESLSFEAASVEERDAIVQEINELVRRAGLRVQVGNAGVCSGGGGSCTEFTGACERRIDCENGLSMRRCSASLAYETEGGMELAGLVHDSQA